MSYSEFFSFTAPQEATIAPADLAFFDHQPQLPTGQGAINSLFSDLIAEPTLGFGSMPGADFEGWSWPDPLDLTQAPHSLQQGYSQTEAAPDAITSARNPVPLDPAAQAFEHNNAFYQPAAPDGSTVFDTQARVDESWTMRKIEELTTMILDLQAKTDQRIDLIEEEIKAVKGR
ncbi:hypothetical protein E8E11_008390 [Didymella keratinophila]|nr:hypothetical protein E8E11_008390 [Didymella keratinophila]